MEYNDINVENIKIGDVNINKHKNVIISILYNNKDLSIKIPNAKNKYFKIEPIDNITFNYCLNLQLMEDIDGTEDDLLNQKETIEFSNFIFKIKKRIIELFFAKLKTDKKYLDIINFNDLNLKNHEIDDAIWDENIDFSYIPEFSKIENNYILNEDMEIYDDDDDIETNLRRIFHLNKNTEKINNFILKCDIVFINKKIKDKKHIYINWYII